MAMKNKFRELNKNLHKASPYRGIFLLLIDIILHKILINTDPRDYFRFEFYKHDKSFEEKSRYVSLLGSRYFPHGNNSLRFNAIFTNKYIQKAILNYMELPTADMVTTIGKKFEINNQGRLNSFLDSLDIEIVIKPISGTHGNDLLAITKDGEQLLCGRKQYTKKMIWNHLRHKFDKGYIVEEKLYNTKELYDINSMSLNTYRVIMIKTEDNKWHNACSFIKFGRNGSQVDNLSAGAVMAEVNRDGTTLSAYDYKTLKPILKHPDSLYDLVGIQFDCFREVRNLAFKASEKFSFMGSIGWDIAATDKGPVIVEGNAWWGEPQDCLKKGIINDEIAKGLQKRNLFNRWDKTKMYPGFYRKDLLIRTKTFMNNRHK